MEIWVSPLSVCFLSRAGLSPMLVFNGVRDAPLGKLLGSSSRALWGRRSAVIQGCEGGQAPGSVWRLGMLKWIFVPRNREEFPSLAQWGRSCLPPEDHGKSSSGSSQLISCACPHLAGAGQKSTCSDLAVVSIMSHGKAVSALEWAAAPHSSTVGTEVVPVSPVMVQKQLQPSALCLKHSLTWAAVSWASLID